MGVTRVVSNLAVRDVGASRNLLASVFGLDVAMDHGWVACLSPTADANVQLQVMDDDVAAPVNPAVSVGVASVAEVDEVCARVRDAGLEVVHGPMDEAWGVRRFFFRDPDGNVINVVANH